MKNLFIGKLNRKEFFIKYIATMVVGVGIIWLLIQLMNFPLVINNYQVNYEMPLVILVVISAQIYMVSLYLRRLHDTKLSPWITLVTIVKPLDFLLFVVLLFVPSKQK